MPFHICADEVMAAMALVPGAIWVLRRIMAPTVQWVRGKLWG